MKKKISLVFCALLILALLGAIAISAYRSSEAYRHKKAAVRQSTTDCAAINPESPKIGIDGVTYICTGEAVPVEPDESAIEYVEIPVGGEASITAFAKLEDGKLLVCRMDGEWYRFAEE